MTVDEIPLLDLWCRSGTDLRLVPLNSLERQGIVTVGDLRDYFAGRKSISMIGPKRRDALLEMLDNLIINDDLIRDIIQKYEERRR